MIKLIKLSVQNLMYLCNVSYLIKYVIVTDTCFTNALNQFLIVGVLPCQDSHCWDFNPNTIKTI